MAYILGRVGVCTLQADVLFSAAEISGGLGLLPHKSVAFQLGMDIYLIFFYFSNKIR